MNEEVLGYRPEFTSALETLAVALSKAAQAGAIDTAVIVGGAAVEFYTLGAYTSGDFDLFVVNEDVLSRALLEVGFLVDDRPGKLHRPTGFYHPGLLIGVEFVSGPLFDGQCRASMIRDVELSNGLSVRMAPAEDMIADRLGAWVASRRLLARNLEQARLVYNLAENLDKAYLNGRIIHDTSGELTLATFEGLLSDGQDVP